MTRICVLAVCGAPLATRAVDVATALLRDGWQIRPMLTPAAEAWVDADRLADLTGNPVRVALRRPTDPKVTPRATAVVVAPMTFNSLAKLATGIADTQVHSTTAELLGEGVPFVAVPMVNRYLAGHPAWPGHVERLTAAGVRWVNVLDGGPAPVVLDSDAAGDPVAGFDPDWVVRRLSERHGR